jgi:hypothetical protein
MSESFSKLDHSLGDVITMLENEDGVGTGGRHNNVLLAKFRLWRDELDVIRTGKSSRTPSRSPGFFDDEERHEGGMFTD